LTTARLLSVFTTKFVQWDCRKTIHEVRTTEAPRMERFRTWKNII
jgi:hypothetical protein